MSRGNRLPPSRQHLRAQIERVRAAQRAPVAPDAERYFTFCGDWDALSPETRDALGRMVELVYAAIDRGELLGRPPR